MYAKHIFLFKIKPQQIKKIINKIKITLLNILVFIKNNLDKPIEKIFLNPLEIKLFKNKSTNL